MSGCLSSSMTGTTDAGPLQPRREESAPLPAIPRPSSTFDLRPVSEDDGRTRRGGRRWHHQPRRRMTSAPPSGQAIQLTPVWEHVVRTRKFPSEVDTRATFVEISDRLRDPEWEVRQHALRVLMDVLPTLNADVVDKIMRPVVPELINNLGHPAPAVRKGALDTLRVYLVHSPNRDNMVKNILHDGLNRPDAHNPFQTNVTTGVILSAPLLLFPSSDSPPPTTQILKDATIACATRLVQVPHQEAVLKSLMKIRDAVGDEEFESYLADHGDKLKRNIDVLSKIYNIKPGKRPGKRGAQDIVKTAEAKERTVDKSWDSDSDTSGIAEEEDEAPNPGGGATGPPQGRVVLETEIKFNEATAITMTILEEKDETRDNADSESGDAVNAENSFSSADRRRTPRRVHFGGEIVKLRTPDSDETESIDATAPKTRIPLPVSPASTSRRRPSSQPCSPHAEKHGSRRASRSASSSPKREYTHNAQLSPKKSILTRTGSPVIVLDYAVAEETETRRKDGARGVDEASSVTLIQLLNSRKLKKSSDGSEANDENDASKLIGAATEVSAPEERTLSSKGGEAKLKLSSPERKEDGEELGKERSDERKPLGNFSNSLPFGSPVNDNRDARVDRLVGGDFVDDEQNEQDRAFGSTAEDRAKHNDGQQVSAGSNGEGRKRQGDRKSEAGNGSVTCSSSEGEGKPQEPNWEELGLVGQEVLDDLHNKEDWRARVRGLERVASALRTSSALIAIESRLGSLLHAVLGGERSCRVAAAGLAVAKVVVAGVSEDALRKKLPQLAWGLARQGGPAAAQLARIAMLRLKPSLLLEQLLQPHCLNARNTKTRENALQLLIFSLVTFPSTEFKLETVAGRVATMVADRRRRVRQAALDTMAVLGQIYDSEEVVEAGKRAAEGHADADAMLAAIRARLARKSLPLVSADGLVVYGLQISPTVQIATGADVDWIVAGSGSVSPGTGRTRGQLIATSRSAQRRARSRNENVENNRESLWMDRPNLVAFGVGLQSRTCEQSAWQILRSQINDDNNKSEIKGPNGRNVNAVVSPNANLRFEERPRGSACTPNQYKSIETDVRDHRGIISNNNNNNNFEQKTRNHKEIVATNEAAKEKENITLKGESKIPILSTRERPKITSQNRGKSINLEYLDSISRKQSKDALDSNRNRINSRQDNYAVGSYASIYRRRKRFREEENQILNRTFDSHCENYHRASYTKASGTAIGEYSSVAGSSEGIFSDADKGERSAHTGRRQSSQSSSRNMQQQVLVETYGSIHERQRKLADGNACRPLRTAPSRAYQESQNLNPQIAVDSDRDAYRENSDHPFAKGLPIPHRRRLRSLSPSQLQHSRQFAQQLAVGRFHAASMYDIDKATTVSEEEYNVRNKRHFSPEAKEDHRKEESRCQVAARERSKSASSSSSSNASRSDRRVRREDQDAVLRDCDGSDNSGSSTPRSRDDPAFDIITQQASQSAVRNDDSSFFTALDTNKAKYPTEATNPSTETSKEWSSEDDAKPTSRIGSISQRLDHRELIMVDENGNRSTESSFDIPERPEDGGSRARRGSIVAVIPNERILSYEDPEICEESIQSNAAGSKRSESLYQTPNHSARHSPILDSPSKRTSRCSSRGLIEDPRDFGGGRILASIAPDEDASVRSLDTVDHSPIDTTAGDSPAIIIASRPHSHDAVRNVGSANLRDAINLTQESTEEESSVNDTLEDRQSKDSTSETNTEPGILKIEPRSVESIESRRRLPSRVPVRDVNYRAPSRKRIAEKPTEKSRRAVQQCFAQLENKDWEVTMKGLTALSQISKQQPECLDVSAAGTIGRLLGRHIKNLRSQVARAACIAAGDVFSSQIRGIDQDLDDIAVPLLHRTADTNRFLRADSNAALDQMMQHLPPHKTIGIIVLRGASHQNAIVRAATARLLSDITDRIGPDHIMILPRDVKDKLLNVGAKLLMDGNLDARNYAKRMFRRLTRCEGFRKALTDAVPETTLRHIDKTMKTL